MVKPTSYSKLHQARELTLLSALEILVGYRIDIDLANDDSVSGVVASVDVFMKSVFLPFVSMALSTFE